MDIRQYLQLVKRRYLIITATGLIFLIVTAANAAFLAQTQYGSTLFFTVSSSKYGVSLYDDIRGADLFSETVQGWTKNPGLIDEISRRTGEEFSITGRIQETENVVIEITANSEESIELVSVETLKLLNEKITEFNLQTDHSFKLAVPTIKYTIKEPKHDKTEPIALMIGVILGIGIAFMYEYLTDKASFRHQIEEALGTQIVGEGKKAEKEFEEKDGVVITVEMGKTNLKELRYIKANTKGAIYPVLL